MRMRCRSLGKSVWEPLVMGKWTPEGGGVEEHPSKMSRMEGRHASVMAEPMRYRSPTVSDYNKQEGWGR